MFSSKQLKAVRRTKTEADTGFKEACVFKGTKTISNTYEKYKTG